LAAVDTEMQQLKDRLSQATRQAEEAAEKLSKSDHRFIEASIQRRA
jgi:hypothetical protein